jgi:hypothetical protein
MKRIGLVRSAMPLHGRHANTTGTDPPQAKRGIAARFQGQNSGALISVKTVFCGAEN